MLQRQRERSVGTGNFKILALEPRLLCSVTHVMALAADDMDDGADDSSPPIDAGSPSSDDSSTDTSTDPSSDPITDPSAGDTTGDDSTQPTTDPSTDPATDPSTQPTTEPTTQPTTNSGDNDNGDDGSGTLDDGDDGGNDDTVISAPAAPDYLLATAQTDHSIPAYIDVSWHISDDTTDTVSLQRTTGNNIWLDIGTFDASQMAYRDYSVAYSTSYSYRLDASNAGGDSKHAYSNAVTTEAQPPYPPVNLSATMDVAGHVQLSWADPTHDTQGFIVQRTDQNGNWSTIATVSANTLQYTDNVAATSVVAYRIMGFNSATDSASSNTAGAGRLPYVVHLYQDVLNRAPDDGGLSAWSWMYYSHAISATNLAAAFYNSNEHHTEQATQLYTEILNRQPDPGGLAFWVSQLNHGASLENAKIGFYASDEFAGHYAAGNKALVTGYYKAILQRSPDAGGLNVWVTALNAGVTRATVVQVFVVGSQEGSGATVERLYATYLKRQADPGGLAYWSSLLANSKLNEASLSITLLSSPEFVAQG